MLLDRTKNKAFVVNVLLKNKKVPKYSLNNINTKKIKRQAFSRQTFYLWALWWQTLPHTQGQQGTKLRHYKNFDTKYLTQTFLFNTPKYLKYRPIRKLGYKRKRIDFIKKGRTKYKVNTPWSLTPYRLSTYRFDAVTLALAEFSYFEFNLSNLAFSGTPFSNLSYDVRSIANTFATTYDGGFYLGLKISSKTQLARARYIWSVVHQETKWKHRMKRAGRKRKLWKRGQRMLKFKSLWGSQYNRTTKKRSLRLFFKSVFCLTLLMRKTFYPKLKLRAWKKIIQANSLNFFTLFKNFECRLDYLLHHLALTLSLSESREFILKHLVCVNNKIAHQVEIVVQPGDIVQVSFFFIASRIALFMIRYRANWKLRWKGKKMLKGLKKGRNKLYERDFVRGLFRYNTKLTKNPQHDIYLLKRLQRWAKTKPSRVSRKYNLLDQAQAVSTENRVKLGKWRKNTNSVHLNPLVEFSGKMQAFILLKTYFMKHLRGNNSKYRLSRYWWLLRGKSYLSISHYKVLVDFKYYY